MPQSVKIATCCYCGTRAALKLDKARHELACAACGAPLHNMKALPLARAHPSPSPRAAPAAAHAARRNRKKAPRPDWDGEDRDRARVRKRRRKGLGRRVLEEIWDVVEDIFD